MPALSKEIEIQAPNGYLTDSHAKGVVNRFVRLVDDLYKKRMSELVLILNGKKPYNVLSRRIEEICGGTLLRLAVDKKSIMTYQLVTRPDDSAQYRMAAITILPIVYTKYKGRLRHSYLPPLFMFTQHVMERLVQRFNLRSLPQMRDIMNVFLEELLSDKVSRRLEVLPVHKRIVVDIPDGSQIVLEKYREMIFVVVTAISKHRVECQDIYSDRVVPEESHPLPTNLGSLDIGQVEGNQTALADLPD